MLTKYPLLPVVPATQNPKASPSSQADIDRHNTRNGQIMRIANIKNLELIDGWSVIQKVITYGGDMIEADGIHPNNEASALWGKEFVALLKAGKSI